MRVDGQQIFRVVVHFYLEVGLAEIDDAEILAAVEFAEYVVWYWQWIVVRFQGGV